MAAVEVSIQHHYGRKRVKLMEAEKHEEFACTPSSVRQRCQDEWCHLNRE